jgi:hypothetical protein
MKTARIQNNVVAEFLVAVEGFQLADCFHASILAQCESVEDDVQIGWVKQEDGSFAAPVVTPAPTEEPAV